MDFQTAPYQPGVLSGGEQLSVGDPIIILSFFPSLNFLKFPSNSRLHPP